MKGSFLVVDKTVEFADAKGTYAHNHSGIDTMA